VRLLARRRDSDADGPAAIFARVIDGDSLWLAVEGHAPGSRAALVHGRESVALTDDSGASESDVLSVRADLTRLDWAAETDYQIQVGSAADGWAPVTSAELPDLDPVRTPLSRDGAWRHVLERQDDGTLTLSRHAVPPPVPLTDLAVDGDAIVCTVDVSAASVNDVVCTHGDSEIRLPLTDGTFAVTTGDLPPGPGVSFRVSAETSSGRRPVARRHHDLAKPGRALVLPELVGPDDEPALRVRFDQDGRLMIRRPEGDS
jgi:hypothetical protein